MATDWLDGGVKRENLPPDIVIMSIRVMHSDWINAARLIRARQPFTTIVVLSQSTRNSKEAVKAGVNAFIGRDITFTEIWRIVGSVTEQALSSSMTALTRHTARPQAKRRSSLASRAKKKY